MLWAHPWAHRFSQGYWYFAAACPVLYTGLNIEIDEDKRITTKFSGILKLSVFLLNNKLYQAQPQKNNTPFGGFEAHGCAERIMDDMSDKRGMYFFVVGCKWNAGMDDWASRLLFSGENRCSFIVMKNDRVTPTHKFLHLRSQIYWRNWIKYILMTPL